MIQLRHARIELTSTGCVTTFVDGTSYGAHPHGTHHYAVISHRLGYGDDILSFYREHEIAHSLVAEHLQDEPSRVLWALAHGREPDRGDAVLEELAAQALQRWVRTNERPIVADVDWDALKSHALEVMESFG